MQGRVAVGRAHRLRQRIAQSMARGAGDLARQIWKDNPLTSAADRERAFFLALHEEAAARTYPEIDAFEAETGAAIDRAFLNELALHTQVVVKKSALNWAHGRLLYSALRDYLRRSPASSPADRLTILETGTARGFSALCMARALADSNRAGTILTLDIVPHEHRLFWNCIDDRDGMKSRKELLTPWRELTTRYVVFLWGESRALLPSVSMDRVHFAFIDAGHDFETVMFEFGHVGPRQQAGDTIVFDDVTPKQFPGIVRAVDEICSRHRYARRDITTSEDRGYVVATKL